MGLPCSFMLVVKLPNNLGKCGRGILFSLTILEVTYAQTWLCYGALCFVTCSLPFNSRVWKSADVVARWQLFLFGALYVCLLYGCTLSCLVTPVLASLLGDVYKDTRSD